MEHAFTNDSENAGVWTNGPQQIFCQWRWNDDARELVVKAGDVTRSWTPPAMSQRDDTGICLDLPETAKDVAQLIERELRTTS